MALCRYALRLAAHIMETAGYSDPHNPAITAGFAVNRQWQVQVMGEEVARAPKPL